MDEELREHDEVLNRTKERLQHERKFKNLAMHVDTLSMCFLFSTNRGNESNEKRGEVLNFLCEYFFSTNLAGQNQFNLLLKFKNNGICGFFLA